MEQSPGPLAIRLFGTFELRAGEQTLPPLRSRREQWLLALLILQQSRGGEVARSWLAALLWPDSDADQGFYNLRRSLTNLRHALGADARRLLTPTKQTVALDLAGVEVDLLSFDEAIAEGSLPSLDRAVALYRGSLLQECAEEWIHYERETRELAYLRALETLAAAALASGQPVEAERTLRRALAVDPLHESAHRGLMQALAAQGDHITVTLVYRDLCRRLRTELRTEPDAETTALYQRLQRGDRRPSTDDRRPTTVDRGARRGFPSVDGLASAASVGRERSAPHLPRPISTLIGREEETEAIVACLDAARLLTLTGTGGVGKTRLAIQVAQTVADAFPDGVWFADLAPLADPALVPQAAARAVGLVETSDVPALHVLEEFLRPRRLLLVLDNCEHLVDACTRLAGSLLSTCPDLKILATSRQPLGITGEIVRRVPSLSLPPERPTTVGKGALGSPLSALGEGPRPSDGEAANSSLNREQRAESRERPSAPAHDLLHSEAVRLFVDRAAAVAPGFRLTEENAAVIAQVCRRLDGIPLAIELAAARSKMMTCPQLLARLEDRFHLLTGGSSTALPRQRTLQATLDWSHDLLSEPERVLLRRLSVFAGGFTLEAAEAVGSMQYAVGSGAGGAPLLPTAYCLLPTATVLDPLAALVDKSLVLLEESGERYGLLETVRQYARERLIERGEAEGVQERHLTFYLRLAEESEALLRGPQQIAALARLETEHDNFRAALDWCLEPTDEQRTRSRESRVVSREKEPSPRLTTRDSRLPASQVPLRLAAALAPFWGVRGYLEEGRRRLTSALEQTGPERCSPHGAAALDGAGALAFLQGDFDAARALYGEGLEIRRQLGDLRGVARSLGHLGRLVHDQGDYPAARALIEEGLAIARTLDDPPGLATALAHLAYLTYHQGQFATTRSLYEESLAISRELEDFDGIATALLGLGNVARRHGEYEASRAFCEESLAVRRAMGDRRGVADVLLALGAVAARQGDAAATCSCAEEALAIGRETGDRPIVADALGLLGERAWRQGDYALARRNLEEALALWRALDSRGAVIHSLGALGHLARDEKDWARALSLYEESLLLRREAQDINAVIASLEDFAELAAAQGQWARMTRLIAAASAQRRSTHRPPPPQEQAELNRRLPRSRTALGETAFRLAWAEGERMTIEEAIRLAMAHDEPSLTGVTRSPRAPGAEPPGLAGLADEASEVTA